MAIRERPPLANDAYQDMSPVSPFFIPHPSHSPLRQSKFANRPSRRPLLLVFGLLSCLTLFAVFAYSNSNPRELSLMAPHATPELAQPIDDTPPRLKALRGRPTERFRDNLRNDTKYITSWISAGWTNDVMTYANVVYLGLITNRVPIIHTFLPSHIGPQAPQIPVSEVFDIDYLSKKIGIPVLEWDDVRDPSSDKLESLGCWSVWQAVAINEDRPRAIYTEEQQGLDISWTAAPDWVKLMPGYEHDRFARFWDIARLTYPSIRKQNLREPTPSKNQHVTVIPDEQLACFDYLYYTGIAVSDEYWQDFSPAWHQSLKHFRWTSRLQGIANGYLRRLFNVADADPIPPYITVHARRGDFAVYCTFIEQSTEDCFPTMADYTTGVEGIKSALEERLGISPQYVIMASDEKDSTWWEAVRLVGWYMIDHTAERTVEIYGDWYTIFIDAVIQSSGIGFLGSPMSTMSLIAGRRVMDWHDGEYHQVRWGYTGTQGGPAF